MELLIQEAEVLRQDTRCFILNLFQDLSVTFKKTEFFCRMTSSQMTEALFLMLVKALIHRKSQIARPKDEISSRPYWDGLIVVLK